VAHFDQEKSGFRQDISRILEDTSRSFIEASGENRHSDLNED
jgi:hypothetical protein